MSVGMRLPENRQAPCKLRWLAFSDGSTSSRFAGTFNQYFHAATDKLGIVFFADRILQIKHFIVTPTFDFIRNIIFEQFKGLCAFAFAVLEDKAILESALANQVHTLLERFFAFTAKPDDKVAGD